MLGGYSEHEQNKKKSLTTRATNSNFKFTEPSCFNYLIRKLIHRTHKIPLVFIFVKLYASKK